MFQCMQCLTAAEEFVVVDIFLFMFRMFSVCDCRQASSSDIKPVMSDVCQSLPLRYSLRHPFDSWSCYRPDGKMNTVGQWIVHECEDAVAMCLWLAAVKRVLCKHIEGYAICGVCCLPSVRLVYRLTSRAWEYVPLTKHPGATFTPLLQGGSAGKRR